MTIAEELRAAGLASVKDLWFAYDRTRWADATIEEKRQALEAWCGQVGVTTPPWMLTRIALTPVVGVG